MSAQPSRVILLGPQRDHPDVGGVVAELGDPGPVALITAGQQEWEEDDGRLREALGPQTFNLRLYGRAEHVWSEDPELAEGHRQLQRDVRLLRQAYNVRLARTMEAWMDLQQLPGNPDVLGPEQDAALGAVTALDDHHAHRLKEMREAFYRRFDPLMRASVGRQRDELRSALERVKAVVITGGHVPSLLNRLRLFGADELLAGRTVVACSGGAMALANRVVLFHDTPPWGPGHAELGEVGLGLYPGVVPFPDASTRLRLDDPGRVSRMARRFAPDRCVLLDPGTRVEWDGHWHAHGARLLSETGGPEQWHAA